MKVALYARVSRDDLHCENQKATLFTWRDRTLSGGDESYYFEEQETTRKSRPVKNKILKDYLEGTYDTIVIVQVGRWARSLIEAVTDIEQIINSGGRFVSIKDSFDFSRKNYNAAAQLSLGIFAAFAQFERELIRERTMDGLATAKKQGKIRGRHPVGCGCGRIGKDGAKHSGPIKPIRDQHNIAVGWEGLKTNPPQNPTQKTEESPQIQQTGV